MYEIYVVQLCGNRFKNEMYNIVNSEKCFYNVVCI